MTRRKRSVMVAVSNDTMKALYQIGERTHTQPYKEPVRSVFLDCPCTKCIDGGIDMPYCEECNRANGFAYFRKKV